MRGVEPRSLDPDPTATATYALALGAVKLYGSTASLEVVTLMEEQGEEWQTAAQLRELASLKELERDIVKVQKRRRALCDPLPPPPPIVGGRRHYKPCSGQYDT